MSFRASATSPFRKLPMATASGGSSTAGPKPPRPSSVPWRSPAHPVARNASITTAAERERRMNLVLLPWRRSADNANLARPGASGCAAPPAYDEQRRGAVGGEPLGAQPEDVRLELPPLADAEHGEVVRRRLADHG